MPSLRDPWIENRRHVKRKGTDEHARIPRKVLWQLRRICDACGLRDPTTLRLHHRDGNIFNNSLANLRLLCASCHAQSDVHSYQGQAWTARDAAKAGEVRPVAGLTVGEYLRSFLPDHWDKAPIFRSYAESGTAVSALTLSKVLGSSPGEIRLLLEGVSEPGGHARYMERTIRIAIRHCLRTGSLSDSERARASVYLGATQPGRLRPAPRPRRSEAKLLLLAWLKKGPMLVSDLFPRIRRSGFDYSTFWRARVELGVTGGRIQVAGRSSCAWFPPAGGWPNDSE